MLVVCGEAVLDLISDGSPTGYQARPGGSPVNVAVGTARLGVPTSLLARFGSGHFGRMLRSHTARAGIDLSLSLTVDQPATLAVVSLDAAGSAVYDFYVDGTADWGWQPRDLPDPLPPDVRALHLGSLASWLPPGDERIAELALRENRRGAVLLSFDPNLRPALDQDRESTRTCVENLARLAQLVKVSAEDLRWLYPLEDPGVAAQRWAHAGPELVVLTDGAEGLRAYRPRGPVHSRPAHQVSVVDTVGAGDACTAGMLAALADSGRLHRHGLDDMDGAELDAVLASAGLVAALTCARPGADPPTRAERDAVLTPRRP